MRRYVNFGGTKTTSSTRPNQNAFSAIWTVVMSRECLRIVKFEQSSLDMHSWGAPRRNATGIGG
jgi:hypothetical protein